MLELDAVAEQVLLLCLKLLVLVFKHGLELLHMLELQLQPPQLRLHHLCHQPLDVSVLRLRQRLRLRRVRVVR